MNIVVCVNLDCAIKHKCGRHRTNIDDRKANEFTSSAYFENEDDKNCSYFIDMNKNENDFELLKNIPC